MKTLHRKYDDNGELVEEIVGDDPRELDFRGEEEPMTMARRGAILASIGARVSEHEAKVVAERNAAFETFLRYGREGLSEEQRAQAVGSDSAGGSLTPEVFSTVFTESLKQHDELFDVATLVTTERGTEFGFPLDDDTSAVATIVAENAESTTASPVVFGNTAFARCPMWRSGHIIASMELAADSAFPLSTVLATLFGARFARGVGAQFVTNLIADATVGVTSASPTALTADELLDLIASVDPAYSQRGSFLMNVTVLTALRKLKASTGGSFLLPFGRDANGRTTLFDHTVYMSPSMAGIEALAKPIAFGDLSRFIRRQVRNSLTVKTYNEKYATSGQIGWEAFLRVDGKLAKAASAPVPIRVLACHS